MAMPQARRAAMALRRMPHHQVVLVRSLTTTRSLTQQRSPFGGTSMFAGLERTPRNIGFVIVPQQKAFVIERLGKFHGTLSPGFHFLIPFLDKVAYVHSLKEEAITIPNQTAITRDNVVLQIDGVLYLRIKDPFAASYGVHNPIYALTQLAQTTMRSELGKISLDKTFEERESLNLAIVHSINAAAQAWGTEVLRYEIKDITPPPSVKAAMDMQAEAERRKRAEILASEGHAQSQINNAEGSKRSAVLAAQGEAEAIVARARASAAAVQLLARAVTADGGREAVSLRVAEQYISAFGRIAKAGNTIILPASAGDAAGMVTQAMSIFGALSGKGRGGAAGPALSSGASDGSPLLVGDEDPQLRDAIDAYDRAAHESGASDFGSLLAGSPDAAAPAPPSPGSPKGAADGGVAPNGFSPKPF